MSTQFDNVGAAVSATVSMEMHTEERQNLDNVVEFSKAAYAAAGDVVTDSGHEPRFSRKALNTRRLLEGRLKLVRDRMKPMKDEEKLLKAELARVDGFIVDAWHDGVRTTDGAVEVVRAVVRKSWSEKLVEVCCEAAGIDEYNFAEPAREAWMKAKAKFQVKQYK